MAGFKYAVRMAGLILLFAWAVTSPAQITQGGVAGTVKDTSGAVVPNAHITLTNQDTNVSLETQSTSSGTYVFDSVPVGTYTLRADASGFKTYVLSGIEVHVQSVVTADVPLAVGAVSQQVSVTSEVPLLQAQDASLGQTIPTTQVNDLPLNGRNWLSLTQLSAGTTATSGSSPDNPGQLQDNGVSQNQVDYRLNGIDNNIDVFESGAQGGAGAVAPVPDAIQEFKLQAGNNSAEFGQFTGAVVNAVTKSGTNRFRGDLWEYFRNEDLNANDYFVKQRGLPRAKYRENQFGGTIGGPVYIPGIYHGKDKTFFFFDYQHANISQSSSFTDTVPTVNMQKSGFTNMQDLIAGNSGTATDGLGRVFSHGTILDPRTTRPVAAHAVDPITGLTNASGSTIYVRDPFYTGSLAGVTNFTSLASQLNVIPAARLDPNAVALLKLLPNPTTTVVSATSPLTGNYFVNVPNTQYTNQYDLRIDENLNQSNTIWGVFSKSHQHLNSFQPFPNEIAGGALQINPNDDEPHWELALGYTHVFSPTFSNDLIAGYDHVIHNLTMPTAGQLGIPAQFGIQGVPQTANNGGLPTLDYSGFTSFGGRRFMPTIQATSGLEIFDNVIKIHGQHEFRAGFEFNHIRGNITQPSYSKGEFGFNGIYSDIPNKNSNLLGVSDFLLIPGTTTVANGISNLGGLSSYTGSNYAGTEYFADYYAAYFQDNWRPTQFLTVNLGLRWEYSSPFGENKGRQANFVQNDGDGAGGTYYIPQAGCSLPRSATFNALLASYNINVHCLSGTRVNTAQSTNFAPRLGIAYRVLPNLVMRAGFGISYGAYDSVGYGSTLGTNYPFQYQISNPSGLTSQTPDLLQNGQVATLETTFAAINLQDPNSVTGTGLSLYGKQYNYKTPYVESANLTIQDQFTKRDSIQVGYVGSFGRHLDSYGKQNAPRVILPPGTSEASYLPFPSLPANMQFLATNAISTYNSLQTVYQHQFHGGLVLLANYTYAKCMADNGGSLSTGFRAEWLPGFGIGPDYSVCGNDATHVIHVSGELALPFGQGRKFLSSSSRLVNSFVGGWNLNYIFAHQTGQPFNVGCPTSTTSDFGCNANLVPGQDPYAGGRTVNQWLNRSAFAQPPAATAIGQTNFAPLGGSPDQVRGPGFYSLDSSLFKNFTTGGETSLQFRLETFNTLNHPMFGNPGQLNFTNASGFSKITTERTNNGDTGGRIVQLALKFFF
ncbi:MAG TPA: TonB-dependent receptor [Bryocella sp.]|nr:TonB-dependent receptor [Bryocella sp.]